MYVLTQGAEVTKYPYTLGNLRRDNKNTSFPKNPSAGALEEWGVFTVLRVDPPAFDPTTQDLVELAPVFSSGQWLQRWEVVVLPAEEAGRRQARVLSGLRAKRAAAYTAEADPLFFKYQRGEGDRDEWLSKIEEIRSLFPYPAP